MKKLKPFIDAAIYLTLVAVLCLFISNFVLSLFERKNLPGFDDSDLILKRVEVPAVSNAFWILLEATNKINLPDSLDAKLNDMNVNTNWDEALAAEVLDDNRACLDLFDQAMQMQYLQVPEPDTPVEEYPYLGEWRKISRVAAIRAGALFRAKKEKEAFSEAFEIIRFGQRAENAGGGVLHYLVASSIKNVGLTQIRQMTAQTTFGDTEVSGFIRELEDFKPNAAGFTNAVKVEYLTQCRILDSFAAGKIPSATNTAFEQKAISIGARPLLNVAETKMIFAQADRLMLDSFAKPYGEIDWSELPVADTNTSFLSVLGRVIEGNAIGQLMFALLEPTVKPFSARKCSEHVNVTATQLLLALKIYEIRHGQLPESLSDLVPEVLPQIPMDDFDGKPFRYLPDKNLIYSVGPDLKDSGGAGRHKGSKNFDIPYQI